MTNPSIMRRLLTNDHMLRYNRLPHPKTTLVAAVNAGYLKGCPGLTASAIIKFIAIKVAT